MSALLDIVAELADLRASVEREFRRAILRASREGEHSGREIAEACGLSRQRVSQILSEERSAK